MSTLKPSHYFFRFGLNTKCAMHNTLHQKPLRIKNGFYYKNTFRLSAPERLGQIGASNARQRTSKLLLCSHSLLMTVVKQCPFCLVSKLGYVRNSAVSMMCFTLLLVCPEVSYSS